MMTGQAVDEYTQKTYAPNINISDVVPSFQSIAIIGNSPKILDGEYGEEIDAHDVVIRINDGRTEGFGKHTGNKTTIRFVGVPLKPRYHDFFRGLKEDSMVLTRAQNAVILAELGWSGNAAWIDRYSWIMRNAFSRLRAVIEVDVIPEKNPRTGILILSMLVDIMKAGKTISLYGFEIAERQSGPEHFYQDGRALEAALPKWDNYHCPMSYEFDALRKLRDKSLISYK